MEGALPGCPSQTRSSPDRPRGGAGVSPRDLSHWNVAHRRLERMPDKHEVGGSSPPIPTDPVTIRGRPPVVRCEGCSSRPMSDCRRVRGAGPPHGARGHHLKFSMHQGLLPRKRGHCCSAPRAGWPPVGTKATRKAARLACLPGLNPAMRARVRVRVRSSCLPPVGLPVHLTSETSGPAAVEPSLPGNN